MTREEMLEAVLNAADTPEAAATPGHVVQVWEDLEVTMQKSGDLMWQRNLHMIGFPVKGLARPLHLRHPMHSTHRCIFMEYEAWETLRPVLAAITRLPF